MTLEQYGIVHKDKRVSHLINNVHFDYSPISQDTTNPTIDYITILGRRDPFDPFFIEPEICPDVYPSENWMSERKTEFTVTLLNSKGACDIFGEFSPFSVVADMHAS
jgi:hypothetical protein